MAEVASRLDDAAVEQGSNTALTDTVADAAQLAEQEQRLPPQPLTDLLIAPGLSLVSRTGDGVGHAFTKLDLKRARIDSLQALVHYPHLRQLDLSENQIVSLEPLQALEYLMTLQLTGNQLTRVPAFLSRKKYLQVLNLAKNSITTFDSAPAPMLVYLNLNFNQLSSLSVEAYPELTHLEVRQNKLTTTQGLGAPKLIQLFAAQNRLERIDGLQSCTNLTHLYLRDNQIRSLDGFAGHFPALVYLNLRGNKLDRFSELDKLRDLPKLATFLIKDNPIAAESNYRLEVLFRLPGLERIDKETVSEDDRDELEIYKVNRPAESIDSSRSGVPETQAATEGEQEAPAPAAAEDEAEDEAAEEETEENAEE